LALIYGIQTQCDEVLTYIVKMALVVGTVFGRPIISFCLGHHTHPTNLFLFWIYIFAYDKF